MASIKIYLILIFSFFSLTSYAHFKPLKKHIQLTISAGPAWQTDKEEKQQKHMGDHVRFIKKLYKDGKLRVIASENGHKKSFGILTLSNIEKAKTLLSQNKAFQNGTLKYELTPITILFESQDHKH